MDLESLWIEIKKEINKVLRRNGYLHNLTPSQNTYKLQREDKVTLQLIASQITPQSNK